MFVPAQQKEKKKREDNYMVGTPTFPFIEISPTRKRKIEQVICID